jgi:alpha-mannosidase
VVKRTFGTALQLMYEYPDYTYTQSAAQYNEWMAQKYPDMNDEIKKRIQEGRWEIVGGMWVEPDLNMPDGESLVRQLLVGKRWYKQAYGVDVRIGWNPIRSATPGSCRRSTRRAAWTISSRRR